MKKIFTLLSVLLLLPFVNAQDPFRAGITPDSIFYGLDIALERVRMALTFGNENKVNYGLRIAEERILEIREMSMREGAEEFIEKAEMERLRIMEHVHRKSKESSILQERVYERTQEHISIVDEAKEQATNNIGRRIEKSIEKMGK